MLSQFKYARPGAQPQTTDGTGQPIATVEGAIVGRTVFARYAPGLVQAGYSPLPRVIRRGHGRPAVTGWSDYCERPLNAQELEQWSGIADADISLACGFGGLTVIDVDDDDPQILAAVRVALRQCTVARFGSKGFALLCRHVNGPQPTHNVYRADETRKDPLVEVMGVGRSIAVPPSVHHRSGKTYLWINPEIGEARAADWDLPPLDKLPVITDADLERLRADLAPWSRKPRTPRPVTGDPAPTLSGTLSRYQAYAGAGLERATAELASLSKGRPTELFRAVCALGWAVAHGLLSEAEFTAAFLNACQRNGLAARNGQRAIEATIRSGLGRAENDPLPQLKERETPADKGADGARTSDGGAGLVEATAAPHTWEAPLPIEAPLAPVPAFDAHVLLPSAIVAWVTDISTRMPCPIEFVATSALVIVGGVIRARCAIKPKRYDDWAVIPNLWGGIVGLPSSKKSPSISEASKPLDRLIRRATEEYNEQQRAFQADAIVKKARKIALENALKRAAMAERNGNGGADDLPKLKDELLAAENEKAPAMRRYLSNDSTVEKLGELLVTNRNMIVIRDELVGLIASWEREGREGDRAFYLEAWNGNAPFCTDRIGRGSLQIPNLCLSVHGSIQPDRLQQYLDAAANSLGNDGMLQRFQLLVYPDPISWQYVDRQPNKSARQQVFNLFEKLNTFDPVEWGAAPADEANRFPAFRFDGEAQNVFIEWAYGHHARNEREDNPLIAQHLSKYDKLFPALALIFHLLDIAAGKQHGPVTKDCALCAAAWCEFLEAHARRCYGLLADGGLRSAKGLASKIEAGAVKDGFTAREVRRHEWQYLKTDEAVTAAIEWLEDAGWLKPEKTGGAGQGLGRPTLRYFINPLVRTEQRRAA